MRCGDWDDMDPFEMYGWGLCRDCWDRHPEIVHDHPDKLYSTAFLRWCARYQRDCERHPTYKALRAKWDEVRDAPF